MLLCELAFRAARVVHHILVHVLVAVLRKLHRLELTLLALVGKELGVDRASWTRDSEIIGILAV